MKFPTIWNSFCHALGLHRIQSGSGSLRKDYRGPIHSTAHSVDVLSGCFWMVRRDALSQIGLLDEGFFMYLEDVDWCKRFHEAGWDVVYFPYAESIHYGERSSSNSPIRCFNELLRSRFAFWRKHHGWYGEITILLISILHQLVRVLDCSIRFLIRPSARPSRTIDLQRKLSGLFWLVGYMGRLHK